MFMKKVLVLGASIKVNRYSNMAIKKLNTHNFEVFGLGKRVGAVGQIEIYTKPKPIQQLYAITMYLGARNQMEYYEHIIQLRPEKVIFNPGSENMELEDKLLQQGINFERACTLVLLSMNAF